MKTVFDIMAENDSERKMADFMVKQKQPYWFKVKYAEIRAREFVQMCDAHDKNYHVSVGVPWEHDNSGNEMNLDGQVKFF
ncbi:MAG: hypothetical protein K1V97_02670 [Lachnospiraceae bacterium]